MRRVRQRISLISQVKKAVITGANSGIGFAATKALARKRVQAIMGCRNLEKAEEALAKIRNPQLPLAGS